MVGNHRTIIKQPSVASIHWISSKFHKLINSRLTMRTTLKGCINALQCRWITFVLNMIKEGPQMTSSTGMGPTALLVDHLRFNNSAGVESGEWWVKSNRCEREVWLIVSQQCLKLRFVDDIIAGTIWWYCVALNGATVDDITGVLLPSAPLNCQHCGEWRDYWWRKNNSGDPQALDMTAMIMTEQLRLRMSVWWHNGTYPLVCWHTLLICIARRGGEEPLVKEPVQNNWVSGQPVVPSE